MRVDVDTSGARLGGTLLDVPLLVTIPMGSPLYAFSQDNGEDLRFVASDHVTVLPHEKDSFNKSSNSPLWVTVPVVTPDTPLHFWIYTHNPAALDAQQPALVWINNFAGVWHGNMGVPNPGPVFTESVAGRDFVGVNMDTTARATGRIGLGVLMDGFDDYAQAQGTGNLPLFANGPMTLSAWVNVIATDAVVVAKRFGGNNQYSLRVDTTNQFVTFSRDDLNGDACRWRSNSSFAQGQWHHVAVTVNSNGTPVDFYVDGSPTGSTQVNNNCNASWRTNAVDLTMGGVMTPNNPPYTDLFTGVLDEVRVERLARNAAWMRYQYLSMINALVTLGPLENL